MTVWQARRLLGCVAIIAAVAALVETFHPKSPLQLIVHDVDTLSSAITSRSASTSQTPSSLSVHLPTTGLVGADRLYRAAREAMARGDNLQAIAFFERVVRDYPRTGYVTSALYYQAFLQYQQYHPGDPSALRAALVTLRQLQRSYPKAPQLADAQTLETRICGALAQLGDAACRTQIVFAARPLMLQWTGRAIMEISGSSGVGLSFSGKSITTGDSDKKSAAPDSQCQNDEQLEKLIAALDGLWKVDSIQALQATGQLLGNRQPCFNHLREQALLIVMQRPIPLMAMAPILFDAARSDPSPHVRQLAKVWLMSQAWDQDAANFLHSIFGDDFRTKPPS